MIQQIRKVIRKSPWIRKWFALHIVPLGIFDRVILSKKLNQEWKVRLKTTLASPDNEHIPRVSNAGNVISGKQVMHNGLKINLGSYYGPEVAQILYQNKGVHEPQEERVFQEVLKTLPEGATMIELGAFWGFYSMWFNSKLKDAENYLIEPDPFNLASGQLNFRLNKLKGSFHSYYIGKGKSEKERIINIDSFCKEQAIQTIHLLHSDIQGFEFEMLEGAEQSLSRVWFVFVSTHSNALHEQCQKFLEKRNFKIICSANKDQSFSEDGLIVAQHSDINLLEPIDISIRS